MAISAWLRPFATGWGNLDASAQATSIRRRTNRTRPDVRRVIGGPSLDIQNIEGCAGMTGTDPSCMEDGPDGKYHLCRVGYVQGGDLRGSGRERVRWRGTADGIFENRREILCKLAVRLSNGGQRLSFC